VGNLGPIGNAKGRIDIQIRDLDQTVIGGHPLGVTISATCRRPSGEGAGCAHGGEIVFTLGTADFVPFYKDTFTDADHMMLQRVNAYWYEFVRAGKPQAEGNPVWQNHDEANDRTMELGETITPCPNFMRNRLNVFIRFLKTMEWMLHR
jgi:carboxylesterase type B